METTSTTTPQTESQFSQYANEKRQHFMQMARDYILNKKDRKTYYIHQCSTDYDDSEPAYYFPYTDEEVARIKQIFIDLYNAGDPDAEPVDNIKTVFDDLDASEFVGESEELTHLVFDQTDKFGVILDNIDFDDPCHLYKFSCYGYDERENTLCNKCTRLIRLTDEEYATILSYQLQDRSAFNFNRLLMIDAALAQKINAEFETIYYDSFSYNRMPIVITLDEAIDDALAVLGQEPTWRQAYCEVTEDGIRSHVCISAEGHTMSILKEAFVYVENDMKWTEFTRLDNIDADAVQQLTGAKDFIEMVEILCKKYNTATAFDDLRQYLDQNNISYEVKDC